MAGSEFQAAAGLVPWIALAYFFYMASLFLDTPFYLAKRTGAKPILLGAAAALNVALYAALIPRWGVYGAAWATGLSFAFFAWLTWRVARRHLDVPYEWGRVAGMLAVSVALVAAGLRLPLPPLGAGFAARAALAALAALAIWVLGFAPEERDVVTRAARGLFARAGEAGRGA